LRLQTLNGVSELHFDLFAKRVHGPVNLQPVPLVVGLRAFVGHAVVEGRSAQAPHEVKDVVLVRRGRRLQAVGAKSFVHVCIQGLAKIG
jgi:hypothetical protein